VQIVKLFELLKENVIAENDAVSVRELLLIFDAELKVIDWDLENIFDSALAQRLVENEVLEDLHHFGVFFLVHVELKLVETGQKIFVRVVFFRVKILWRAKHVKIKVFRDLAVFHQALNKE
jgi:hypothetical protein